VCVCVCVPSRACACAHGARLVRWTEAATCDTPPPPPHTNTQTRASTRQHAHLPSWLLRPTAAQGMAAATSASIRPSAKL
jgi:hypothetical protein